LRHASTTAISPFRRPLSPLRTIPVSGVHPDICVRLAHSGFGPVHGFLSDGTDQVTVHISGDRDARMAEHFAHHCNVSARGTLSPDRLNAPVRSRRSSSVRSQWTPVRAVSNLLNVHRSGPRTFASRNGQPITVPLLLLLRRSGTPSHCQIRLVELLAHPVELILHAAWCGSRLRFHGSEDAV